MESIQVLQLELVVNIVSRNVMDTSTGSKSGYSGQYCQ